jgi:hypothetical protein
MKLSADQHRVLELVDQAGPRGATEALLIVQGATVELLVELVRAGLVTAATERVRSGSGGKLIEVARVRITGAGRDAL